MKPDLLVDYSKHCDYPIFRRFLRRHRDFFGKIIIYFNEAFRHMYYDVWTEEAMKDLNIDFIHSVEYKYGIEDWRNVGTQEMLKRSESEWICSIEQDFFAKDWDKLFSAVSEASKTFDLVGYKGYQGQAGQEHQTYLTGNYCHPAFWFMKRSALEKTNKDFSADTKKGADHFGLITQDCEKLGIPIWYTQEHGFPETEAFHQGGITMNYLEFKEGYTPTNTELFYLYNYYSMFVEPQNEQFLALCKEIDLQRTIDPNDERRIYYE
jgi:hypothetical protein